MCGGGRLDAEDVAFMHNGILLSHEKGNGAIYNTTMGLNGVVIREISHVEKDTNCDFSHLDVEWKTKTKQMNR